MTFSGDLELAIRTLRRGQGFSLTVLLLLALGVGATTAMFSVVNGVLLQPLPLRDPGQLMLIGERIPGMPRAAGPTWLDNAAAFLAWRRDATDFAAISAVLTSRLPVSAAGQPRLLHGAKVSANFFDMLEVRPALGRTFVAADATDASDPVILTDSLWKSDFNADPAIVGRDIALPGSSATVIGVLPATFRMRGRELGPTLEGSPAEFFRPLPLEQVAPEPGEIFSGFDFHVIGRLRPGVRREQALAQLDVILANLARTASRPMPLFAELASLQDFALTGARQQLWLLLAGAAAVLLIICVNLGGLWISRLSDRRREWGIRAALGAAPHQLARLIVVEALGLGLAGGILGIGCAALCLRGLLAVTPANLPRLDEVHLDGRVLVFGLLVSVLAGLLTGLVPALRLGRLDPQAVLRDASGATTSSLESIRSRQALIALQAALSTLLLGVAGLLGLSFFHLIAQPPGFIAEHAAETEVSLLDYSAPQRLAILRQLPAAALSLPGVSCAGFTTQLPLTVERGASGAQVPGQVYPSAGPPSVNLNDISPGYLDALGLPLLAGRDLRDSDRGLNAMVISAAAAHAVWPGDTDPGAVLGRPLDINQLRWTIVGVVSDTRTQIGIAAAPVAYVPYWVADNWVPWSGSLVVRGSVTAAALQAPLRRAVAAIAPAAPISELKPLREIAAAAVAPQRYQLILLLLFAALALCLAALGVYALISHNVTRRAKELAIRISLGADAAAIWTTVMRQALAPVALGITAGLLAVVLCGPLLDSLLFQVNSDNPAVLAVIAAAVGITAICACLAPGHRATQTDPLRALRAE